MFPVVTVLERSPHALPLLLADPPINQTNKLDFSWLLTCLLMSLLAIQSKIKLQFLIDRTYQLPQTYVDDSDDTG